MKNNYWRNSNLKWKIGGIAVGVARSWVDVVVVVVVVVVG